MRFFHDCYWLSLRLYRTVFIRLTGKQKPSYKQNKNFYHRAANKPVNAFQQKRQKKESQQRVCEPYTQHCGDFQVCWHQARNSEQKEILNHTYVVRTRQHHVKGTMTNQMIEIFLRYLNFTQYCGDVNKDTRTLRGKATTKL